LSWHSTGLETRCGLDEFLDEFPEFIQKPDGSRTLRLEGVLSRALQVEGFPTIESSYRLRIVVVDAFPGVAPAAFELGGKIPQNYHHLKSGALCLGAPIRMVLALRRDPTMLGFARTLLIPYLYGYSHFGEFGKEPWPGLGHDLIHVVGDYRRLLGVDTDRLGLDLLRMLGVKKRVANRRPCPCESGLRLGRCHHRRLNSLRTLRPRSWYRAHHQELEKAMRAQA